MKHLQSCNGCKKNDLFNIKSTNFHICLNCLLISTKVKKNYFLDIKKDFKTNKIYNWNKNLENLEKDRKRIIFFLIK